MLRKKKNLETKIMFNPDTKRSKKITIDCDTSDIREVNKRLDYAVQNYLYEIEKIFVYLSSTKGYSIKILFRTPMLIAKIRNELKDDGFRLMKDILRSHSAHDILWDSKVINNIIHEHHLIKIYILTITYTNYVKIRFKDMSKMQHHSKGKDGNCKCFWVEENETQRQDNSDKIPITLQEMSKQGSEKK